jgi:hypothetical protein
MVCFEIDSNPAPEANDGLSKFTTDNMIFRFFRGHRRARRDTA